MAGTNLLVIQAGGPTAVVNESLFAVVDAQRQQRNGRKVFGARSGLQGLIQDKLVDLEFLTAAQLEVLRNSPGAALGTSRVKPSDVELAQIVDRLRRREIHQALFIGGNGTMHAALMISRFCKEQGYELQVIGVPKTVDNDIRATDRCPGYASAAHYVAQSTRDLAMDLRALPQPVSILETMGRHVGWLAAASVAGKRNEAEAPHLVYLPEVSFNVDEFINDLEAVLKRQDWAIVVVSEGFKDEEGRPVFENADPAQADAFKRPLPGGVGRHLAETVARRLKIRCRDEKPGLLGRASMHHVSPRDKMDAELVGRTAYEALQAGHDEQMVALTPLHAGEPAGTKLVPLDQVRGADRSIPSEWLGDGNPPPNKKFMQYLQPLIGELLEFENVFDGME